MEWNNATIPTDAFSEDANLNLTDDNDGKITVGQQFSIQRPRPEEYITISKWDLGRIRRKCESLKKQSLGISDVSLTIGSLAIGAFFSFCFSGTDITTPKWRLWVFVSFLVVGVGNLIIAFFMKKGEHDDAKKSAEDIEEILIHIYPEEEALHK